MEDNDNISEQQLASLIARCKEIATIIGDGKEVFTECTYCHGPVSLWEALFTQQIAGVLAHVACPEDKLEEAMSPARPDPAFDFADFTKAVDQRMTSPRPEQMSGTIEYEPVGS